MTDQGSVASRPPEAPKNGGQRNRRCRSDLGLKSKSFRSKRTSALLENPFMRKHIAHSMGLDPSDPHLVDMVNSKLDLNHVSGQLENKPSSSLQCDKKQSQQEIDRTPRGHRVERVHIPSFNEYRLLSKGSRPLSTSFEILSSCEKKPSNINITVSKSSHCLNTELQCTSPVSPRDGRPQSVRFVEDENDELILDICDVSCAKTAKNQKREEITSDLEEELSESNSLIPSNSSHALNIENQVSVLRSTSDVSDMVAEETRKRLIREKRSKPYKSDPFCTSTQSTRPPTPPTVIYENTADGMSREEVLSFLHHVTHGEPVSRSCSMKSLKGQDKVSSSFLDLSQDASFEIADNVCLMCCENDIEDDLLFVCDSCSEMSQERKEAIREIIDTEQNYCQNLIVLRDEFYSPLKSSGLLSSDQLASIFSNFEELLSISQQFVHQLKTSVHLATQKGDTDYTSVHIGRPFLEASSMLLAFETYCTGQSSAHHLLDHLMEEKNLLRLFLAESLKENEALRRMDLKSFLMLPVQRVMKYPLLLGRLAKVTHERHRDHRAVLMAKSRMQEILEHINMKSKGTISMRSKKKAWTHIAKKASSTENIELNKAALELLGWSRHEAYCLHTGHLHHATPSEHQWGQKMNTLKFQTSYAVLVSHGRNPKLEAEMCRPLLFPHESIVKEVALVLFRDKNGRFLPLREPLRMSNCVVSKDPDANVFHLTEMTNDPIVMKGDDAAETCAWLHLLTVHGKDMGQWRRRRKALPNIMMHHKPISN